MANGTIAFDTLQTSGQITGTAKSVDTDYVVNGSAKAWHLSDSSASPSDSLNISGGTDNGTGDYTYSFTNSMGSVSFSPPHITAADANNNLHAHTRATGSVRVNNVNEAASARDANNAGTVHGDLA